MKSFLEFQEQAKTKVKNTQNCGCHWGDGGKRKSGRELSGEMEIFCTLKGVCVTKVHPFAKIVQLIFMISIHVNFNLEKKTVKFEKWM